ncbi:MAG TPA: NAD(P)/FAD-dependent oxidoreductase [Acidimicrobiia bacterium]|nr:NAD(P)/FAD-dependent oxidoreductase [Acidimicrobiia bacterium]
MEKPRVVIVGGGFGGLHAAKALATAPVEVVLIDRRNHHTFQPLLYQVATAGLSAIEIAEPIRRVLRKQGNATVLMGEVSGIDLERRVVMATGQQSVPFDFLILATGVRDAYFGHEEWAEHAPGLKSVDDALAIRHRLLTAFERAEVEPDETRRAALLTFVIIGGGATGAELAGAIAEISRHTFMGEFRRIDPGRARVMLIEGSDRILSSYRPALSAKARTQLEKLGVEVLTGSPVTDIDEHGVSIGDRRIDAGTVLWAAGVEASPLGAKLDVPVDEMGRVLVTDDLSIPGHPHVFVIGDLANVEQDGRPVAGVAPAAIQMGRHAARSVTARLNGDTPGPFRYVDRGTMATLGRSAAIAQIHRISLSGFPAWLAWLFVHLVFLIGFRNRLVVLLEWARSYLTHGRSARLIVGDD